MPKFQFLSMFLVTLLISGCFLSKVERLTETTVDEVKRTNQQMSDTAKDIKETNKMMKDLRDGEKYGRAYDAMLKYCSSEKEEAESAGMEKSPVDTLFRYAPLDKLTEDRLYRYFGMVYPLKIVSVSPWVGNVALVRSKTSIKSLQKVKVNGKLAQITSRKCFDAFYEGAEMAIQAIDSSVLRSLSENRPMSEIQEEFIPLWERAIYIGTALLGAIEVTSTAEGNYKMTPMFKGAEKEKVRELGRKLLNIGELLVAPGELRDTARLFVETRVNTEPRL